MKNDTPPFWRVFAAFFTIWLVLGWPWLSGTVTIPWDAKAHWYPHLLFLARAIHTGESFLWTHNIFAGSPEIADPQSLIFSPLHMLLALTTPSPTLAEMDRITFFYLLAGGTAVLVFFRDRQWHWAGALVAATVFAFGCSNAWRLQHINQVGSMCLWIIAWVLLDRGLRQNSILYGIAAALVAGLMVISRDQVALFCTYHLAAYALVYVITHRTLPLRMLIAGVITGLVITAGPILMSLSWAEKSNRVLIDYEGAGRGSLHPASLLSLVIGNLYGASGEAYHWGPPNLVWGETYLYLARNMSALYSGAAAALFLTLAFVRGDLLRRDVLFITGGLVLVLLFTLGWYTPVFGFFFNYVPFIDQFRRPADATFLLGGHIALLAGYGAHRLFTTPALPSRWQMAAFAAIWTFLVGLCIYFTITKGQWAEFWPNVVQGLVAIAATMIAVALAARWRLGRPALAAGAILVVLTADLAVINGPNMSTGMDPAGFEVLSRDTRNEMIALVRAKIVQNETRRDRVEFLGFGYHWQNITMTHDFEGILGFNPVRSAAYAQSIGAADIAVPDARRYPPLFAHHASPMARILGMRLIATDTPIERFDRNLPEGALNLVAQTRDGYLYENTNTLPRVQIPSKVELIPLDSLIAQGWPKDFDPATDVVLDPIEGETVALNKGTARLISMRNSEVIVETTLTGPGILVLNNAYHPWWEARQNNRTVAIRRANSVVMAVPVPSGTTRTVFTFRPFTGVWVELPNLLREQ